MKPIIFLIIFPLFSFSQIQIGSTFYGENFSNKFGNSVSISSNGNIIAIGAPNWDNGNGKVRVFENVSGVWTQLGQDIYEEFYDYELGTSVSLSSNGSILAIGVPRNNNVNGIRSGNVKVFENISGVWTQVGSAINGENTSDFSGSSVSLSSDGSTVAISALENFGDVPYRGNVRIFKNINGVWTQIGDTFYGEQEDDYLGFSISLSSDGSIVAIGVPKKSGGYGYVKIYKNISGNWIQVGQNINSEQFSSEFGSSVSLSSDGTILAIGAPNGNGAPNSNSFRIGYVKVYDLSTILSSDEFVLTQFSLYPNPATNQVTIQLQEGNIIEKVTIYNILGKEVLTSTESIINTSKLESGLYIVKVKTTNGTISKKLIIE